METGTVKFFNNTPDKLYGFIEARGSDVFFHFNQCDDDHEPERLPRKGDRVEFERTDSPRGPKAKNWHYEPYVSYSDLCHSRLGTTSQVGAYYVGGLDPYPNLSEGIRFQGDRGMYHSLRIHRDDVERFVARVKKWEAAQRQYRINLLVYANMAERTYFFSSKWQQPDLPEGFEPTVYRLPMAIKPRSDLHDGIITRKDEVVRIYLGGMREIPNPNPEYQAKRYDEMPVMAKVADDGGSRSNPEREVEGAKPIFTLIEAKALLESAGRHTLADHAFGDAELDWIKDGEHVASGYFGRSSHSVTISETQERDATTFRGDAADKLRSCGKSVGYTRNDSQG